MILELKIQNFLSFKDEVKFSFEATSDKSLEDYYVTKMPDGTRILKMAMVYGANASGKSNLVKAFEFLNDFIGHIPGERYTDTFFVPFMFDDCKDYPGKFELLFYVNDQKHKYQLVVDSNTVIEEKLFSYPGTQPAMIFNRYYDAKTNVSVLEFGAKIKISSQAKEAIQLKALQNTSVFAAYNQVNISIPELDNVVHWFINQFLDSITPYDDLTSFSDDAIKNNPQVKQHALRFLREADFNITDVLFKDMFKKVPEEVLQMIDSSPLSEEEKAKIKKEKGIHVEETIFTHKIIKEGIVKQYSLPESRQSQGTIRFYGLSAPFYHAIENNAFLPVDEIGSALHPILVMHFLREFLKHSNHAQLFFTTHNLSLLMEKDILRKDAIWFTEKKDDGSTELYSMADFNFRKELSFYNAYKQGKFGAIPVIDD